VRNPNLWHVYEAVEDLVEQLLDQGLKQVVVKQRVRERHSEDAMRELPSYQQSG
jgi:hypothetical protein